MSARRTKRGRRGSAAPAPPASAFQAAVKRCRPDTISSGYHVGKQALKGEHRQLVRHTTNGFTGSLDLDTALTEAGIEGRKWDYGIGYLQTATKEACVWVEVHPASLGEVEVMLAKLNALRAWLKGDGKPLAPMTKNCPEPFVWIPTASGVSFSRTDNKVRDMLAKGLRFPERPINLPMR